MGLIGGLRLSERIKEDYRTDKMNISQILALIVFIVMFVLIITEVIERHQASLLAALAMILIVFLVCRRSTAEVWEILSVRDLFHGQFWYETEAAAETNSGINWATIIFLGGMMIMVEAMGRSGFFRYICLAMAKLVKYKPLSLFVIFMIISAVLSMFIGSLTVVLFLASVTVELAALLNLDPIPMIIAEVFCANLGGAATMCGDPPNLIIGTQLGYSFFDFLFNAGLIALVALVISIIFFYFTMRKKLVKGRGEKDETVRVSYPDPASAVTDKQAFARSSVIFILAIVMLITHAQTGLTIATIGVVIIALTLLFAGNEARAIVRSIDYKTLLFFIGLFVVVGGLEKTGILEYVARIIADMAEGNIYATCAIILWISGICSAFVDNIPFAATMVPVIESLSSSLGIPLPTLAWTLAIGTDVGGNATPIGASANVVGISIAAKSGHLISWPKFCRYTVPGTIIALTAAMALIFVIHC